MEQPRRLQKKIAVINDMSGFGRCSIAVSLPVISKLKVQCCPFPTSIFSNHTAFANYFFDDYTEKMPEYMRNWELLGLSFSGIYSGFLGSEKQIDIVAEFIQKFRTEETQVIIDPVMGDHGKAYVTYTKEMCGRMKQLVRYADILTPNITEACILTDTSYKDKWQKKEIEEIAEKLTEMGPSKVVITGIAQGEYIANYVYEIKNSEDETARKGKPAGEGAAGEGAVGEGAPGEGAVGKREFADSKKPVIGRVTQGHFLRTVCVGQQRCGTGDIFASIIAADAVNGVDFSLSVKKASNFVKKCILKSIEMEVPMTDGVAFEEVLDSLK